MFESGFVLNTGSGDRPAPIQAQRGAAMGLFSEAVEVVCSPAGIPLRLIWQGRTYKVAANPVRWYERRRWWEEEPRAERGHGPGLVDSEIWRVQARLSPRSPLRTLDISRQAASNTWRLIRIHDALRESA